MMTVEIKKVNQPIADHSSQHFAAYHYWLTTIQIG